MYVCDKCGRQTEHGERCNIVVVETRPKVYINTINKGTGDNKFVKTFETRGTEIAKTEKHCNNCANVNINRISKYE